MSVTEHGAKHIARLEKRARSLEARMYRSILQNDFSDEKAELASIRWAINEIRSRAPPRAEAVSDERVRELLEDAWKRMDRARDLLTDGNPRYECNWGMLDTKLDRAALSESKKDLPTRGSDG